MSFAWPWQRTAHIISHNLPLSPPVFTHLTLGTAHPHLTDTDVPTRRWNDADMQPWLERAPVSMDKLMALKFHPGVEIDDVHRLIAIVGNKIFWLHQLGPRFVNNGTRVSRYCLEPCNGEVRSRWYACCGV